MEAKRGGERECTRQCEPVKEKARESAMTLNKSVSVGRKFTLASQARVCVKERNVQKKTHKNPQV